MKRIGLALAIGVVAALMPSISQAQLPFSNVPANRPTISPYLGLLNASNPGVSNYLTYVRPQLQAREEQLRQQAQINQIQRQVQRGQAGGVPVRGSQEIRGTGHETVYLNYSHYYPVVRR
jgi:septation ring formation regulator EzrA